MPHPIWPFFDLRVTTPRLQLVAIDDAVGTELALLAARGVHDPSFMPFGIEWTDVASPQLERNTLQFYWRTRAEMTPAKWDLNFGVVVDGQVVGATGLMTNQFAVTRTFETGSWLGIEFQGQGIGTEMRAATLQLAFEGFGAEVATTAAFHDNGPSLGVTGRLGYEPNGTAVRPRRGQPAELKMFRLTRAAWVTGVRRDDIVIEGAEACLPLLGLADDQ